MIISFIMNSPSDLQGCYVRSCFHLVSDLELIDVEYDRRERKKRISLLSAFIGIHPEATSGDSQIQLREDRMEKRKRIPVGLSVTSEKSLIIQLWLALIPGCRKRGTNNRHNKCRINRIRRMKTGSKHNSWVMYLNRCSGKILSPKEDSRQIH